MLVDHSPGRVCVELRHQHHGVAREQCHPGGRLGRAVDHRRDGQPDHRRVGGGLLGQVVLVGDRLAGGKVGATEQNSVDVLVAPHDALGESGGAESVQQVDVVLAARAEVTLGRTMSAMAE